MLHDVGARTHATRTRRAHAHMWVRSFVVCQTCQSKKTVSKSLKLKELGGICLTQSLTYYRRADTNANYHVDKIIALCYLRSMDESETHRPPGKGGRLDLPVTMAVINSSISRLAPLFQQAGVAARAAAESFRKLRKVMPPDRPEQEEECK